MAKAPKADQERRKAIKAAKDRDQHDRFLELAKEVGAIDDADAFDRAFKKIANKKSPS